MTPHDGGDAILRRAKEQVPAGYIYAIIIQKADGTGITQTASNLPNELLCGMMSELVTEMLQRIFQPMKDQLEGNSGQPIDG